MVQKLKIVYLFSFLLRKRRFDLLYSDQNSFFILTLVPQKINADPQLANLVGTVVVMLLQILKKICIEIRNDLFNSKLMVRRLCCWSIKCGKKEWKWRRIFPSAVQTGVSIGWKYTVFYSVSYRINFKGVANCRSPAP
jgi:hypothetical protein